MAEPVTIDVREHVAEVALARPEKRNAVNLEMFEALSAGAQRLAADASVRTVVLRGEGEHFCAGIDTTMFTASSPEELVSRMRPRPGTPANLFQHAAYAWRELPVPVIAALDGVVFGAGLLIAMGADIRIASKRTRCSVMEIRWGIIPDMALTATMRHVVRHDRLRELTYTGRIVDAEEAAAVGLVTELRDDPLAAARELAAAIATRSPDALRTAKRLLNAGFDAPEAEALKLEAELQLRILGRPNQLEAARANVEKRAPRFSDPEV